MRLDAPSSEVAAAHGSPLGVTFFPSDSHQGGYVSLLRKESESDLERASILFCYSLAPDPRRCTRGPYVNYMYQFLKQGSSTFPEYPLRAQSR
eukprot:scaffold34072_cov49-Phaeocystis_antarctica.AAC.2